MRTTLLLCCFVLGCGDDGGGGGGPDGGGSADAPSAPAMITISGEATKREGATQTPAVGAMVAAYKNSDPNTPVAMTTTDAAGMYTMTLETGGVALDGYLKASLAGFLDLYLYPPKPLTADFAGASLNIVNQGTVDLLGTLCQNGQDAAKGVIALIIADAAENPIAGATVMSNPAAAKYCYNMGQFPGAMATMTQDDGIAYMLNVTAGNVTVNATKSGTTFVSHTVNARAGAFTTTVISP
jgi:hypothetical protein